VARSEFATALDLLRRHERAGRCARIRDRGEWKQFKNRKPGQWAYIYRFARGRFAWGTSTGNGDRLARAGMLEHTPRLSGKYDRRVDYLMLRLIDERLPDVWVMETEGNARDAERAVMRHFKQSHCFRGFDDACCRLAISRAIYAEFRETKHYRGLKATERRGFDTFMGEGFFIRPPLKNGKGITFKYGDALEPRFFNTRFPGLAPAVEAALRVEFPR
jgi:hypothetical protein